eukprot:6189324-Pleurochrysis_carterae.AAC.1
MDGVINEMMNITDEMAATDAKEVKAKRTNVGWLSSPSSALIYQGSKYVALHSSKGYAIHAKFRQWLDAELHGKEKESFENELLGSVEDMLAICGSRDYACSSSTRLSLSASRSLAACAPNSRRSLTLAPRLERSCATRSSPALAPRALWRQCARWPSSASSRSGSCCARSAPTRTSLTCCRRCGRPHLPSLNRPLLRLRP